MLSERPEDDPFQALAHLFEHPWWTRAWVVQEVMVARKSKLVYGQRLVSYEACERLAALPAQVTQLIHATSAGRDVDSARLFHSRAWAGVRDVIRLRSQRRGIESGEDLMRTLYATRRLRTTDPRDRFYSLMSILPDIGIAVDYSDIPERVAAKFCFSVMDTNRNLDILSLKSCCQAQRWEPREPAYPSWASSFTVAPAIDTERVPLLYHLKADRWKSQLRAGGSAHIKVEVRHNYSTLVLHGVFVDRITSVHEARPTHDPELAAMLHVLHENGRGWCRTEYGSYGLMPAEARIGDIIVIACGGKTPYVVRQADSECFRFVGEW